MKNARIAFLLAVIAFGNLRSMAQRPLGVDVSHYQGTINWPTVKASGISFAWTKATESASIIDSTFTANEVNAKAAGVLIGAYHFAHPETHIGSAGADQEAAYFWAVCSNYVKGSNTYLMPMLDIEQDLTGASPAYTKATLSAWVNEFCNYLTSLAAANGVAIKPVVYTYVSYATTWLDTSVTNWPLWMAQYPGSPNPQTGAPSGTSPWSAGSWSVWQYSSTATVGGISGGCDADVFNGTAAGLSNLTVGGYVAPLFTAPSITSQPLDSRALELGGSASFSASAIGTAPLSYQWTLNGTKIPGATTTNISISNAQSTNAGFYALIVTNNYGSVTSSVVSLLVYPLQTIVFSDDFETNSASIWTLNQSSADNSVAFNFDYAALSIPPAPNSAGSTTHGLQMKANLSLGVVAALSLSPTGKTFSGDYRLHFDGWINVNGPIPGGGGSTEALIAGIGTAGNRTEWTGTGSTADGYYFGVDGDGGVSDTSTTAGDYEAYASTTLQSTSSGVYFAGTDTTVRGNGNAYYTAVFPGQSAPNSQIADYPAQTGTLNNGTFGFAWHDVIVSRRGSVVDWVIDGVRIAAISNATFTANNICVGYWDQFASLSASNAVNFGLVDNLRVEIPAVAPVLTLQPRSVTNGLGSNVTFTATATGVPTPGYQWKFNGTNIPGAVSASYSITNLKALNAGTYSVTVSNVAAVVNSTNAVLSVTIPSFMIQSVTRQEGGLGLQMSGHAGSIYAVDFSTNFTTWTQLTQFTNLTGTVTFTDNSLTNGGSGFYRMRFVGP